MCTIPVKLNKPNCEMKWDMQEQSHLLKNANITTLLKVFFALSACVRQREKRNNAGVKKKREKVKD